MRGDDEVSGTGSEMMEGAECVAAAGRGRGGEESERALAGVRQRGKGKRSRKREQTWEQTTAARVDGEQRAVALVTGWVATAEKPR